jgi:hypothetical protein
MKRLALISLSTVLVLACDRAPTSPASDAADESQLAAGFKKADVTAAAWGAYTVVFGANVERIAFRAGQTTDGVIGRAKFNNRTAHVKGEIDINCLQITGNIARISGIVTKSSDPTIEGFEALWQVQDNGDGHKAPRDLSSTILLHAVGTGSDCTVPGEFDMVPIRNGQIHVAQ